MGWRLGEVDARVMGTVGAVWAFAVKRNQKVANHLKWVRHLEANPHQQTTSVRVVFLS